MHKCNGHVLETVPCKTDSNFVLSEPLSQGAVGCTSHPMTTYSTIVIPCPMISFSLTLEAVIIR